jgi:putative SOS response-associated peptidase YedK
MCFSVNQETGVDSGKGIRFIDPAFVDWWVAHFKKGEEVKSVFPLGEIAIVRANPDVEHLMTTWGLLPSWAKEVKFGRNTYNARAETVNEKPSFKSAILTQRCLIPVTAFWEWSEAANEPDGKKHLYHIKREDGQQMVLGGLWESHPKFGESSTIITTEPIEQVLKETHHTRSPLVLEHEQFGKWLDPRFREWSDIKPLLRTWNGAKLKIQRVK